MNDIVKMVEGIFPGTVILLIYYSGSIAYGLNDELSDKDITVVLDNFKGNMQLDLGEYDFFVFSKERFIQRQQFDESIIAYYKGAADDVMKLNETAIYINPDFEETLDQLLIFDHKEFMLNHIESVVEYSRMRYNIKRILKSHYHVFRIRGMVDHFDKTGKYELIVEEPWKSKMIDFKNHWNTEDAKKYEDEILEQLDYLENYRNEMMQDELGKYSEPI